MRLSSQYFCNKVIHDSSGIVTKVSQVLRLQLVTEYYIFKGCDYGLSNHYSNFTA